MMIVGFDFDKSFVVNIFPFVSSILKSGMVCDMATRENDSSKTTNKRFFQSIGFLKFIMVLFNFFHNIIKTKKQKRIPEVSFTAHNILGSFEK